MKKIMALLAVLLFSLVGCSSGSLRQAEETVNTVKSVSEIYTEASALSDVQLTQLDSEYVKNYYGIDMSQLKEGVLARASDPQLAETIIIIRSDDSARLEEYKGYVENVFAQRKQEMVNYNLPEQAEIVDNAKLEIKGDTLYAVASAKAEDIASAIEAGL